MAITRDQPDAASTVARTPRRIDDDRLTIGRLMLITAGIAFGIVAFPMDNGFQTFDDALLVWSSILMGASLPGLWFVAARRRQRRRIGAGGWIALSAGLGLLVLMPAAILQPGEGIALTCLHYLLPLSSLWMLLSALVAGQLRCKSLGRRAPWPERYGYYLALSWSPVALRLLWSIYFNGPF